MSEVLHALVNRRLTSVEFVHDYFQMRFDEVTLTINAPAVVKRNGLQFDNPTFEFRGEMINLIGEDVRSCEWRPDDELVILFANCVSVSVSLRPEEQVTPEAAVLTGFCGRTYVW